MFRGRCRQQSMCRRICKRGTSSEDGATRARFLIGAVIRTIPLRLRNSLGPKRPPMASRQVFALRPMHDGASRTNVTHTIVSPGGRISSFAKLVMHSTMHT